MSATGILSLAAACLLLVQLTAGQANIDTPKCCGDLGCYDPRDINPGGLFYNIPNRPINSMPDCTLTGRIYLRLTTRTNPQMTQLLTPYATNTISGSNFSPLKPTKVLMHGFLDRYTRPPWQAVADALLKDGDYNVIRVDWSQGNVPPYVQACANLRLVGAYLAKFLNVLVTEFKVDPSNIHLIGHSLGAHGSGYAGSLMQSLYNTTIGRITGLDPAGPYFNNMPTLVRLDQNDAAFVDTIVTNGDVINAFGSPTAMGHMNFFPNGGINQPGCSAPITNQFLNSQDVLEAAPIRVAADQTARGNTGSDVGVDATVYAQGNDASLQILVQQGRTAINQEAASMIPQGNTPFDKLTSPDQFDLVGCSHNRAVLYYASLVVKDDCKITGYQCDSYDLFLESEGGCGECKNGTTCSRLGLYANQALAEKNRIKRFYTVTRAATPYCANFKVQFTLQKPDASNPDNDKAVGSIYLQIAGSLGKTSKMLVSDPEYIELVPGKSYSFYPELSKDLGTLKSITLSWKPKSNSIFDSMKSDYIFLDGNIIVIDNDSMVNVFTPAQSKVQSVRDVVATFTLQRDLKK